MRKKEREIKNMAEIESIIQKADVCRIALTNDGIAYIVTMNFGYSGGVEKCIYFHCATGGRKLEMIRKNNYACFEMDIDHYIYEGSRACDFGMGYKSVVGWGRMVITSNNEEKKRGLDVIMAHYSGSTGFTYNPVTLEKMLILRLDITEMTGKKHIPDTGKDEV